MTVVRIVLDEVSPELRNGLLLLLTQHHHRLKTKELLYPGRAPTTEFQAEINAVEAQINKLHKYERERPAGF